MDKIGDLPQKRGSMPLNLPLFFAPLPGSCQALVRVW